MFSAPYAGGLSTQYELWKRRSGAVPIQHIAEREEFPASFPYDLWAWQQAKYQEYWRLFSGDYLREEVPNKSDKDGTPTLRYPLQINYLKTLCMKRNYTLWGEAPENPGPLVPIRIVPRRKKLNEQLSDEAKQRAFELESHINRVWIDNNGRSLQQEAGLIQQPMGGIVIRVTWDPTDPDLENETKLQIVLPEFFLPVWDSSNPDRLFEAFVVWRVPAREAAERFGYDLSKSTADPLYIEHWKNDTVTITLNLEPITVEVTLKDGTKGSITYDEAENPYGFVPFVYIATERAGSFMGVSAIEDLEGLSREMNARLADLGDVIGEGAHRDIYTRNVTKSVGERDLGNGRKAIDLGMTGLASKDPPDAFVIEGAKIADGLIQFPDSLRAQYNRDAFVPPVADGEDEGSQRSALTLAFRMWPLTSKTRALRTSWTGGLLRLAKMIARIAIIKGLGGITEEHLKDIEWSCDWPPMIPRDRESEVNEVIIAHQAGVMSRITAIRKLNMVTDPDAEDELIRNELKEEADLQMMQKQKAQTETTSVKASTNVDKM